MTKFYERQTGPQLITSVFRSPVGAVNGKCFIAVNISYVVLFDGNNAYVAGVGTFDVRYSTSPWVLPQMAGKFSACTNTLDEQFFLFFDGDKMYLYDYEAKVERFIGKICKQP